MPKILNKADLVAAFDLPYEEAIAYLEGKDYAITFDWREMLDGAHKRAFTVAGVMQLDVLQTLLNSLIEASEGIDRGPDKPDSAMSYTEWLNNVEGLLQNSGYLGGRTEKDPATGKEKVVQLTPYRLENIYRTNLQSAYNAARFEQQLSFADRRPFLQYLATIDNRTTPICQGLHGKIFRADDPIWTVIYPPNHFRCRARVASASERELKKGLPIRNPNGEVERVSTVEDGTTWKSYRVGEGFAAAPNIDYKPDLSQYDKQLKLDFEGYLDKNKP